MNPEAAMPATTVSRPTRRQPFVLSETAFGYLLNLPALLLILALVAYPIGYSFWVSLHRYNLKRPNVFTFVGLDNYIEALQTPLFWHALTVTTVFSALSVVGVVVIGTAIALISNEAFRGRGVLRSLILLPWAIPPVVNGLMWQWIFNSKVGAFNGLLYSLGIIDTYQAWLLDSFSAMSVLVFAHVWNQAPFAAIVVLAGLQAIPSELYDAAKVDRANIFERFRNITLPWLLHPLLIIIILQTMIAFRTFDIIYVMTGGGPGEATTVVSWLAFQTAFVNLDFGMGNAYAYLIALLTLGLSAIYIKSLYSSGEIRQ
jgi:multiple sugar transport system permease protein